MGHQGHAPASVPEGPAAALHLRHGAAWVRHPAGVYVCVVSRGLRLFISFVEGVVHVCECVCCVEGECKL